jgi:hypothetical protein
MRPVLTKLAGARGVRCRVIELPLRDPGRFGVLFERQADEIIRYAHAWPCPDLAEDVLPETALAAFRLWGYKRSKGPNCGSAWRDGPLCWQDRRLVRYECLT